MPNNTTTGQKQSNAAYHLYAPISKPYFSYKKPGESGSYSMLIPQIHSGNLTLKFTKFITSENRLDINCYLPYSRMIDFSNILEGIMARRRDSFAKNEPYSTSETFKIPVCSYLNGKEEQIGNLTIDTELIDGVPKLRITYFQNDKNDGVSIVFNDIVSVNKISASTKLVNLDYADVGAFGFVVLMKSLQEPLTMIMYHMLDATASSITRFVSTVIGGSRRTAQSSNGSSTQPENYIRSGGGDEEYESY
jgi:hypothetical protein